ncbi:hypothetical protein DASC09_018620 [Saccharomycopsis crataegensis]|uniref:Gfd2/YDR514C-like C-terminal domain-containing protein n=1 Tax=Saccharomycopsis crataegensis TaxID=43959 RepID=A0AAV5QIW3_9ASCO|nr:hypothetical protein DASC09_018620 [Saccharomycopsis crataegensis]
MILHRARNRLISTALLGAKPVRYFSVSLEKVTLLSDNLTPSQIQNKSSQDSSDIGKEVSKYSKQQELSLPQEMLDNSLQQIDKKLAFYSAIKKTYNKDQYQKLKAWLNWLHNRQTVFIAIDLEAFEHGNDIPLEVGISILDFNKQKNAIIPDFLNLHFIVKEYENKTNGRFVPNNKNRHINGASYIVPKHSIPKLLNEIFHRYGDPSATSKTYDFDNPPPFAIVGQSFYSDELFLSQFFGYTIPSNIPVIDIGKIWKMTFETSIMKKSNLTYMLKKLNIPGLYLHNGANDSYYTLLILLKLLNPEARLNFYCKNYDLIYDFEEWKRLNSNLGSTTEQIQKAAATNGKHDFVQEVENVTFKNGKYKFTIDDDLIEHFYSPAKKQKKKWNPSNNCFIGSIELSEEQVLDRLSEFWKKT